MAQLRRILVPLAGRDTDGGLLCYAAMLRRILGDPDGRGSVGRLHTEPLLAARPSGSGLAERDQPEFRCVHAARDTESAVLRARLDRQVAAALPGALCQVVEGDPLDSILAAATEFDADLVLLGHASERRRRSLARRLAARAPCSVWMAPAGSPPSIRRILIPIDFSRRSADTVAVACALAEAAGLDEALALHVHFNDALVTFDELDEILAEDRDRAFCLFVAPIDLRGLWLKPLFVDSARVADAIVRAAQENECDLIVMGTRGRSPSAAVLLGSETEQCIMTTTVPLLAIKHFGARLSFMGALRDERLRRRGDTSFT